jgi:CHAT domain-containing protein
MYDVVLWEKGFIAQSVEALRARILASGDAQAIKLLEQLTEKKSELAKLASAPPATDAQQQAERRARIEQLENEANDLEKELVSRSSALGEQKRLARVTWQQVRDALKPGEATVEIVRFPYFDGKKWTDTSYYVALVLRHESRQPAFIVLGEKKDLEGAPLDDYSGLVAEPDPDAPPRANAGKKFYAAFWQPLEAELAGATRVYLSPDGALNQVALGVAPRPDGKLVMDVDDLRTVNSTKDLLRQAAKPGANAAVLVGNPKFDATEAEQRAALDSASAQNGQSAAAAGKSAPGAGGAQPAEGGRRSRDLRGGALIPLPGTQREVDTVAALLRQQHWQVQTYTQVQALEERVTSVRGPRLLHLATHGFFESDQKRKLSENAASGESKPPGLEDPMLRSGVYLAGANRILTGGAPAADMDDGILTAFEATQMNLEGTELVVLSACQSGLGHSEAGEGVFGLRRGLQEAGAEAVLLSMWSVPDKETQELMTKFYAKWAGGMDKHQALRAAQEEVRAEVRARDGMDEPFFWGAFVLVGR